MRLNRSRSSLNVKLPAPLRCPGLLASSLLFILVPCLLTFINQVTLGRLLQFGRCALSHYPRRNFSLVEDQSSDDDPLRVLIGILMLPERHDRRHFLRTLYGAQSRGYAHIDVKFIFCNLTKEEDKVLIALEIMRYDDIVILSCPENMDNGKTYTYFSSLPEMLSGDSRYSSYPPYHYVMKADDDTFLRLENLVESLKPLPRKDLYYGYVIPCNSMDPFVWYMSGMGYLISWDLVEWIRDSDIPRNNSKGPEDFLIGDWFRNGRRAKNRHNGKWSMYNFPRSGPWRECAHEFWPNTTAVHLLKDPWRWMQTLKYFNVTSNLKPSRLYHIP